MGPRKSGSKLLHGREVVLFAVATLVASCAGGPTWDASATREDAGVAANASPDVQMSSVPPAARLVVETATRLAAKAPELTRRLDASRGAWKTHEDTLASQGFRSGGIAAVGARLPSRGDGALRVGLGRSERYTLTLTPEGARGARVEWMYLLRSDEAPSRFTYALALPEGLPTVKVEPSGQVAFADAKGSVRMRMPAPFAVDAKGERREAKIAIDGARLAVSVETAGLAFPVLLDPAVEVGVWEERKPVNRPPARARHAMAYDSMRQRTVLFGGSDSNGDPLGDTWEWDGTSWTQKGTTGPSARFNAAMAYDSTLGKAVLFGGYSKSFGDVGDTWEWDGASWTQVATTGPSAREGPAMAYDSLRKRTVLFGGGNLGDTWEWDGASWTQVASTGPSARRFHTMAYDGVRTRTVLFGGLASGELGDTWEWDGTGWTQVATTGPSPRSEHAMVFDSARGKAVVFGGNATAQGIGDTWEWGGTSWKQLATAGPSARWSLAMAYDDARARTVLFGGIPNAFSDETWEYYTRGGACSCPGGGNCASSQCETGYCVDSVCCEESSLATTGPPNCGTCERCDSAANPGVCETVKSAEDPDTCDGTMMCGSTGVCGSTIGQPCTPGVTVCASGTCAGGYCKKNVGEACSAANDCASGFCADGYCCTSPCDGACDVCNATPGTCTIVATGSPGANPSCSPYLCGGAAACPSTCASDDACADGFFCDAAGKCAAQKPLGAPCDLAASADCRAADCRACASGLCIDGVCCDSACEGACNACSKAAGAPADGTCANAAPSALGSPKCAPYRCSGTSSACATECATDDGCSPGYGCADGMCIPRGTSCKDDVTSVDSKGTETPCAPYRCASGACRDKCNSIDDCTTPNVCDGTGHCVSPDAAAATTDDAGCGCRVASGEERGRGAFALAMLATLALARRRRGAPGETLR